MLPPNRTLLALVLAILATMAPIAPAAVAAGADATFYVSPDGRDDWTGRHAAPHADGSDGPFATVNRAQQAVRKLLRGGARGAPIVVEIRGGFYELPAPLVFTSADSGAASAPIVYRAAAGEHPVLSGGRRLAGWHAGGDGWWRLDLPEVRAEGWSFTQLWVNDQRRFRPSFPRSGYASVAFDVPPSPAAGDRGHDGLGFAPGDIDPSWQDRDDVELLALHVWTASHMRFASIDPEARIARFTGTTFREKPFAAFRAGDRYRVVNVREALGAPGTWYLDRHAGELTYVPRPGERPDDVVAVAPRLEHLVELRGDDRRGYVRHLRFEGLTFAHAAWRLPPEGQSLKQGEEGLGAAIEAAGARYVTFDACVVRHVGGYGMAFRAGCRIVRVERCELVDLGAGGVYVGASVRDRDTPETRVTDVTVRDCFIAHGGRLHPSGVGVLVGIATDCSVEHNDIHDFFYAGVVLGRIGMYGPSRSRGLDVGWNRISRIGQGLLSDMGAVYATSIQPGTVIHHNVIHDVICYDYGGWGIYLDAGASLIRIANNVVYQTQSGGFHQTVGYENIVRDNIFAEGWLHQIERTHGEKHVSFRIFRNIVYWTNDAPLLSGEFRNDLFVLDENLYWNPRFPEFRVYEDLTFAAWRERRDQDAGSIVADPLFVAPKRDDYRLRPESPAIAMGFQTWDHARAGRRDAARRTAGLPPVPSAW